MDLHRSGDDEGSRHVRRGLPGGQRVPFDAGRLSGGILHWDVSTQHEQSFSSSGIKGKNLLLLTSKVKDQRVFQSKI